MSNKEETEMSVNDKTHQDFQQQSKENTNGSSGAGETKNFDSKKSDSGNRVRRNNSDRGSRSRRRSRSPRGERDRSDSRHHRRVYVANIPFDVRWAELKDLFRDKVGNVRFCQLFENEEGKPRGCGLVEFDDASYAQKAIELLDRFNLKGRELVVKEDLDMERDRYGRLILKKDPSSSSSYRDRDRNRDYYRDERNGRYRDDRMYSNGAGQSQYPSGGGAPDTGFNLYGLSPQFLTSLGIRGPLNNRIFVANLSYKVGERKLEDIFKLAGKVTRVRLYCDNEGKSKGFGIVEFEHPVEAVQAISMFHNQKLYDRTISVRLDKFDEEDPYGQDGLPAKLPKGLESIGKGLGIGGQPLNIAKSGINQPPPPTGPIGPPPINPTSIPPVNPQGPPTAPMNVMPNMNSGLNLPSTLGHSQIPGPTSAPAATPYAATAGGDMSSVATAQYSSYSVGNGTAPTGYPTQAPPAYPTASSVVATPYSAPVTQTAPPTVVTDTSISSYSTYDTQRDFSSRPGPGSGGVEMICVRNLPPTFSWQNLHDRFSEVGEVRFAELKGSGTALVRFASDRDAQRAVNVMNGIRLENRTIEVSLYY